MRTVSTESMRVIGRWSNNAGYQVGNPSIAMVVAAAGVAPAAAYQAWLDANAALDSRARTKMTGGKLQRAVRLIKNGHSVSSAARAVDLSGACLGRWLEKLPAELAA